MPRHGSHQKSLLDVSLNISFTLLNVFTDDVQGHGTAYGETGLATTFLVKSVSFYYRGLGATYV